ncbi:MAG: hypothetical protein KY460_03430 [Actinobacteria bacterium]|nr:hypothetical protein [Actinomycetota bacterium]
MDGTTAAVDDLITEAIEHVEHAGRTTQPEQLALVRDQLVAAATSCADTALAADADGVLAQLDHVLRGLDHGRLPLAS